MAVTELPSILVVEDKADQRDALAGRLAVDLAGFSFAGVRSRSECISALNAPRPPAAIIVDMDLGRSDPKGGLELAKYFRSRREQSETFGVVMIVLTAYPNFSDARDCMEAGVYSYIVKAATGDVSYELLLAALRRGIETTEARLALLTEKERASLAMAEAICGMVDAHEPYTGGHSRRVAQYCSLIARALGMDEKEQRHARIAGLVHDMGKVGLDSEVLSRPASLSRLLFAAIREHPVEGYRMLENVKADKEIAVAVLDHHMRLDGKGYPSSSERPKGLPSGPSFLGQILGVADSFDAMTTPRPYMKPGGRDTVKQALEALLIEATVAVPRYDKRIVEALVAVVADSDGQPGIWSILISEVERREIPPELLLRNIDDPPPSVTPSELTKAMEVHQRLAATARAGSPKPGLGREEETIGGGPTLSPPPQ